MILTIVLAFSGCVLLFLMIWEATVTMPFAALAKNFPKDVQEKLKPRIENLPLTPKRVVSEIHYIAKIEKEIPLPAFVTAPWMIKDAGLIYGIKA